MFKKFFKFFGGVNELEVKVEALLQEVALLREDHRKLSVKVADHYEEEVEIDYKSIVDNISYSQLALSIIDISDSNVNIDNIANKVFEKFLEKLKNID